MRRDETARRTPDPGRVAYLLRRCRKYCGDSLSANRAFWQAPSGPALEQLLKELDALSYHIELLFAAVDPVAEDEAYYSSLAAAVIARERGYSSGNPG